MFISPILNESTFKNTLVTIGSDTQNIRWVPAKIAEGGRRTNRPSKLEVFSDISKNHSKMETSGKKWFPLCKPQKKPNELK